MPEMTQPTFRQAHQKLDSGPLVAQAASLRVSTALVAQAASSRVSFASWQLASRRLLADLRHFLTGPRTNGSDSLTDFWFVLSLAFSVYFASQAIHQAFGGPYVVQDDARQHVFWMERFLDSQLFPNDLIADYFQSVAPSGYSAFYNVIAHLGVDPMLLNKLLPMVLGLITTAYGFAVCLQMLPVPGAAFFGTLILNQSLWMQDDLVSATPRAFLYPLFLAFLYYLLRDSRVACLAVIALQGLFYPSTVFISAGVLVLRLVSLESYRPRFSTVRRDYWFSAMGLGVVLSMLLLYAFKMRAVGPVITASEARLLPEFYPGGRTHFFGYDGWRFWLIRPRSGLLPGRLLEDVPLYAAPLLPLLLYYRRAFPLAQKVTESINVLPRIIVGSLLMFAAAHLTLFKLHHPSRYTEHTLRIVLAMAAGLTITIILDGLLGWASRRTERANLPQASAAIIAATLVTLLVLYPRFLASFPQTGYRTGREAALYEFLSNQPKDAMVASLAQEVKNIPAFSKRSILVSREYALPYHTRYYAQLRQRASDLINAHYSPNLTELQEFIHKYKVSLLLVERRAFTPEYLSRDAWIMQYQPQAAEAIERLKQQSTPAIAKLMKSCAVLETEDYVVLDGECILKASP
jgi:hypothetical protein